MHTDPKMQNSLVWSISPLTISCVFEYLNADDLNSLYQAFVYRRANSQSIMVNERDEHTQLSVWARIAKIKYIFKRYLNSFDRSYFFSVYGKPQYNKLENERLSQFALSHTAISFFHFQTEFHNLILQCSSQVHQRNREKLQCKIIKFFTDADISLPKLMRESCCSDVSSPFQYFLLEKSNPDAFLFLNLDDDYFETVCTEFQQQEQNSILLLAQHKTQSSFLTLNADCITSQNFMRYRVEGFKQHNFLLALVAITENYLSMAQCYAGSIQDQFERFLQLSTRYSMFVNTIISIEESLGPLFKAYTSMYNEVYCYRQKLSTFCYWKTAIALWQKKMSKFYDQANKCYLDMVRLQMNKTVKEHTMRDYEEIWARVELAGRYEYIENSEIYEMMRCQPDEINILMRVYQQHLVDCSINETSVHSCGHSEQNVGHTYLLAETSLIKQEEAFLNNLTVDTRQTNEKLEMEEYLNFRIDAAYKILKPRTTKRYMELYASRSVSTRLQEMEIMDEDIASYVQHLKRTRILKMDSEQPIKLEKGSGDETRDSLSADQPKDQKEQEHIGIQLYESDNEIQEEELFIIPALIAVPSS